MKKVIVIESAKELVDAFSVSARDGDLGLVITSSDANLEVGVIQNAWIGLDNPNIQIAPHVTFEQLFLELCKRTNIHVKSTVIK